MAKIDRFDGNVQAFASQAQGTERTIFGDTAQSNTLDANINTDFLRGWGIVGVNENPTKQDFAGLAFTLGQLISYLHQRGIPEWNTSQEFYEGSVVTTLEGIYRLKAGGTATVNPDSDAGVNWELAPTREEIEDRVIRVTSIAAMEAYSVPVGYVFSLNDGGRSGTFDVIAGDFSAELAADTENGIYIGLADDPTATTKVAKRVFQAEISVSWFGAFGESDDTVSLKAALAMAAHLSAGNDPSSLTSKYVVVFSGAKNKTFYFSDTLYISRFTNVKMYETLEYSGPADRPAVVHGEPGEVTFTPKSLYRVTRTTAVWPYDIKARGSETDVGLVLYNFNSCALSVIELVRKFEVGVKLVGDGTGFAYNHLRLGYIVDSKVQLWLNSVNNGWLNENSYFGGRFGVSPSVVNYAVCSGIRSLASAPSVSTHNNNTFYSPSFEGLGSETVPVVDAEHLRLSRFLNFRNENNGPVFLKEGERSGDNELKQGYGPLLIDENLDDSLSETPSSVSSSSSSLIYDRHTEVVWDSGNIRQRACPSNGDNVHVIGMMGNVIGDSTSPYGDSSVNSLTIEADGVLTESGRVLGLGLDLPDTIFGSSIVVKADCGESDSYRVYVIVFDTNGDQITDPAGTAVRGRSGNGPYPGVPYWGGCTQFGTYKNRPIFIKFSKDVRKAIIYVRPDGSPLKRMTIKGMASSFISPTLPYIPPVVGAAMSNSMPTSGASLKGQITFNYEPVDATSPLGWRCLVSGDPGTWEAF